AGVGADGNPGEEDAGLAIDQRNSRAVKILDWGAIVEADVRITSTHVQQDGGRQGVVVVQALRLGVNKRSPRLRDDGRQSVGISIRERVLALCSRGRPVERQLTLAADRMIQL